MPQSAVKAAACQSCCDPAAEPQIADAAPRVEPVVKLERIESYSIRRVHQFPERDDQPDPDFVVDEWADERPPQYAGLEPIAEFWRMVGFYPGEDGQPAMIEVGDAKQKRGLVELYCRITGRSVPLSLLDAVDSHNLPA